MKRIAIAAFAAASIAMVSMASIAAQQPDATLDLSGGSVGVGVGVNWGKGTLHYQGRSIPVTVKGLSIANVGAASITATGEVYNLKSLSDFAGNYAAASAGATLAGGGNVSAMQNQKGVVIHLRSTTKGVDLDLGVDGVSLALK